MKDFVTRIKERGRIGWHHSALKEGYIEAGNDLTLRERTFPQWTVATANAVMRNRKIDVESAQKLAQCPALAPRWQETLSSMK